MSTTGVIDFNASTLTGKLVGDQRSLVMSVIIVDDDIDEVDEVFAVLLELVSAENPDRVDLSERNISLARINDDDGECDCVCVCIFADCSEMMYVECIIPMLVVLLPTSPISLSPSLLLLPLPLFPFPPDIALSFEFSSYTVSESQLHLPLFIVKEPRSAITEIEYQYSVVGSDVTATSPDDYRAPEARVYIQPERQQLPYTVQISDDYLIEEISAELRP